MKEVVNFFPEFDEAMQLMRKHVPSPVIRKVPILEASGAVVAETVSVPYDSPPFHQSAMDGYALHFTGWDKKSPLKIVGEVAAGMHYKGEKKKNCAVRIFTGAMLPSGFDTVIVQEKIMLQGSYIIPDDPLLVKGANVRKKGSHLKAGDIACRTGERLSTGLIALLASLGIAEIKVFFPPVISIIVTGNELTKPGHKLKKGHVYECNSYALIAALGNMKIIPESVVHMKDDPEMLKKEIKAALLHADMLILTGGVSVGDYDFVAEALQQCGVRKIFHKVKQKPGKPIFFGTKGKKLVFGLPGNPASVLSCFYTFVVSAINKLTLREYNTTVYLPALNAFVKKGTLTGILKAKTSSRGVEILNNQESYKLNSFAQADALVLLPPEKKMVEKGDLLKVLLIDY